MDDEIDNDPIYECCISYKNVISWATCGLFGKLFNCLDNCTRKYNP